MKSSGVWVREEKLSQSLEDWIYKGFREHSLESIGHDGGIEPFVLTAYEDSKRLGIVVARTFWGAWHIKHLYIPPYARKKGVGSQLMEKALEKGREKGCPFAFVETMSFQAVDFYKKLGFIQEFSRLGYAKGTSFHYLKLPL